jgi:hypothetical protein
MKHLKRASELLQFGGRTTDDEIDSDDKKLEQLKDKDATLLKKNSSKKNVPELTKLREEIARIVDRKRQLNEEADIEEREW